MIDALIESNNNCAELHRELEYHYEVAVASHNLKLALVSIEGHIAIVNELAPELESDRRKQLVRNREAMVLLDLRRIRLGQEIENFFTLYPQHRPVA